MTTKLVTATDLAHALNESLEDIDPVVCLLAVRLFAETLRATMSSLAPNQLREANEIWDAAQAKLSQACADTGCPRSGN